MITKEMLIQLNETLNKLLEVEKRFQDPNVEREKEILEELKTIHSDIASSINKIAPKSTSSLIQEPIQENEAFYNQRADQPEVEETEINPIGALLDSVIEEDEAQKEKLEAESQNNQSNNSSQDYMDLSGPLERILDEIILQDQKSNHSTNSKEQEIPTEEELIQESNTTEVENILGQVIEKEQKEKLENDPEMEQEVPTEEEPLVEAETLENAPEPDNHFAARVIPNYPPNLENAQLVWNEKIRKPLGKITPSNSKVANNYKMKKALSPDYNSDQDPSIIPNEWDTELKSSPEKEYEIKTVEPSEQIEEVIKPVALEELEHEANSVRFKEENNKKSIKKPLFGIVKKVRKASKNISKEIKIRAGIVAAGLVLLTCSAINYRQPNNGEDDSPKIAQEAVKSPNLEKTDLEKKIEKYLNPLEKITEKTEEEQTEEETDSEKKDQTQEKPGEQSETEELSILKIGNTTQVNDDARIYTDEYNAYLGENSLPAYYNAGEERLIIGVSILNENGLNHIFASDSSANQKINDLIQNGGEVVSVLTANKKYLPTYDGNDILTPDEINAYAEGWYNINDITNQNAKGMQK